LKSAQPYRVSEYLTENGRSPFRDWLESLNLHFRARIQARIFRFESGNLGDYKALGENLFEARLDFGPGFRVYFGIHSGRLILLLLGGDKKSQRHDIQKARTLWIEYLKGKKNA
jgi:putative addiction module killer protein